MSHDIIPEKIWEGPLDQFIKFLRRLKLSHPLCKGIFFEYVEYHGITVKQSDLLDACPLDDIPESIKESR